MLLTESLLPREAALIVTSGLLLDAPLSRMPPHIFPLLLRGKNSYRMETAEPLGKMLETEW